MMPVDEQTLQALDFRSLSLPAEPAVVGVDVEDYVDSSGEDALRVWVILAEEVNLDQLSGDDVLALKAVIRRSLQDHHIDRYAYVYLIKASERQQVVDEETHDA
jgi:hypothetical protein